MERSEKERTSLFKSIISSTLTKECVLSLEKLDSNQFAQKIKVEKKISSPKKKKTAPKSVTYENIIEETNFKPAFSSDTINELISSLDETIPEELIVFNAIHAAASIFYSFDRKKRFSSAVKVMKLLLLHPNSSFDELVIQSIAELLYIVCVTEEKNDLSSIIENIREFTEKENKLTPEFINQLAFAGKSFSSDKGLDEDSVGSKIIEILEMIIKQKPDFLSVEMFPNFFEIIEKSVVNLNKQSLKFLKQFHFYLPEEIQNKYVDEIVENLPSFIEENEAFIKFHKKEEIVELENTNLQTSSLSFGKVTTFDGPIDLTIQQEPTNSLKNILNESEFEVFLLLFSIFGESSNEVIRFLNKFYNICEGNKETEFCMDYLCIYALALSCISTNIQDVQFEVPTTAFDPYIETDKDMVLFSIRRIILLKMFEHKNFAFFDIIAYNIKHPMIIKEIADIISWNINTFVPFFMKYGKSITDLAKVLGQLQTANEKKEATKPEYIKAIEEARIALFKMLYMLFQKDSMLENFMSNACFVSFFMATLFEVNVQDFSISQLKLYISSVKEISIEVSISLETIINQIVCTNESLDMYLDLLSKLLKMINTSSQDFSMYKNLSQPLGDVLVKLNESPIAENIVVSSIIFFINYSLKETLNNIIIESIGNAMNRLKLQSDKVYESLVQLAACDFISKIKGDFRLVNPLVVKILFDSYYKTDKDIIGLIKQLCESEDNSEMNCISLHKCLFDEHLLHFIRDNSENYDKRIMEIFIKIASISSSPTTVQLYLSLFSPIESRYAPVLSSNLLGPLKELFDIAQESPEVYLYTIEELKYELTKYFIKDGFSISCWIYLDTHESELFSLIDKNTDKPLITFSAKNGTIIANNNCYLSKVPLKKWVHTVLTVKEDKMYCYCNTGTPSTYGCTTSLKSSSFKFYIGKKLETDSCYSKVTNIILTSPLSESEIKEIYQQGRRSNSAVDGAYLCVLHDEIAHCRPNLYTPFADILLRHFNIQSLLPLFVYIDIKTKEDNYAYSALDVTKTIKSALAVSEKEEINLANSEGTKIIAHLLMTANPIHLSFDLYMEFYDIFESVKTQKLKELIFNDILMNFDLWAPASNTNLLEILTHWRTVLFKQEDSAALALEKLPLVKIVDVMRMYLWYEQSDFLYSRDRRSRSEDINVSECRRVLIDLAVDISKKTFTRNDLEQIILNAITVQETQQNIDLLVLIKKIAKAKKPSPLDSIGDLVEPLSVLRSCSNPHCEGVDIALIDVVLTVHKCCSTMSISTADHLEIIFNLLGSKKIKYDTLEKLTDLLKEYPELFKMCSYFYLVNNSTELYDKISQSSSYAVDKAWCYWAVMTAIKLNDPTIFNFLVWCGANQWETVYYNILMVCEQNNINKGPHVREFLHHVLEYISQNKVDEKIISSMIQITIHFILFHSPESIPNMALYTRELNSPYEECNSQKKPEEDKWEEMSGFTSEDADKFINKDLKDTTELFSLDIIEGDEVKWNDEDLAEFLLSVSKGKSQNPGLSVIAAFISRFKPKAAREWFKDANADSLALLYFKINTEMNISAETKNKISNYLNSVVKLSNPSIDTQYKEMHNEIVERSNKMFERFRDSTFIDPDNEINNLFKKITDTQLNLELNRERNAKIWRSLWRNSTVGGGPWEGEKKEIKWKRAPELCANFCPFKMKENRNFSVHMKASIARDTGNSVTAEKKVKEYEEELREQYKKHKHAEIFDVDDDADEEEALNDTTPNLYSFDCELIRLADVIKAQMKIFKGYITITTLEGKIKTHTIQYTQIVNILHRRRFHHRTAIEIFLTNGKTYLINFQNSHSSKVIRIITSQEIPNAMYIQKAHTSSYFKTLGFTEKWKNRQMSNFEYLMKINIFSGRSFSDASQYPFLPWTINNFTSDTINLDDESIFRNLSLPIGAIGQQRLEDLLQRMEDMKQFGQTPYLYSSFAICPLSLYLWFVRMEPFTTLHIDMQSGKFDHASRLFTSIADTFNLCNTHLNDYRELVPEFFFQDEFLINMNGFDLGMIKNKPVGDVKMPPWAYPEINKNPGLSKIPTLNFVYIMRKSMESEYVSQNINNWIDLFWGYKQTGKEAENALNTYGPNTYEQIWTKENLNDEAKRASIEATMCHVGTIPPQIFKEPHPVRNQPTEIKELKAIVECNMSLGKEPLKSANITINGDRIRILCNNGKESKFVFAKMGSNNTISISTKENTHDVIGITNVDIAITRKGECIKLIKNEKYLVDEKLRNITKFTSDREYTAIVTDRTTLKVIGPNLRYSIEFYGKQITCLSLSRVFHTIVCGTVSQNIVFCSLFDATKTNIVPLNFTPTQVAITPSWGFIIATGKAEGKGKQSFNYSILTTNGREMCSGEFSSEVQCITTWTDDSGFDFAAVGCEDGKVRICEAFCGFVKAPESPFAAINWQPIRLNSKVLDIEFYKPLNCVAATTEDGKIYYIPIR